MRTGAQKSWARAVRNSAALLPGLLWMLGFLVLPLAVLGAMSFLSRGDYGDVGGPWTGENYRRLAGFGVFGFDPVYPGILLRSLGLGLITAGACAALALPVALCVGALPERWRRAGLLLVVVPFWTNLLVRTYAWQILLGADGPLPRALGWLGFGDQSTPLYPGFGAVYLCMVCDFLPFAVLPVYASVEKADWQLADAARDLGAGRWQTFWHAVLPQLRTGLAAGFLLVFLPASGQFVIPDLLGGAQTMLLGNLIQQQFGASRDWPFGAAVATISVGAVLAALSLGRRLFGRLAPEKWP